jgi:hypothetical protein
MTAAEANLSAAETAVSAVRSLTAPIPSAAHIGASSPPALGACTKTAGGS